MTLKEKMLENKLNRKDRQIKALEETVRILQEKLDDYAMKEEMFEQRKAELDATIEELNKVYKDILEMKKEYQNKLFEFEKMKLEYKKAAKKAVNKMKK